VDALGNKESTGMARTILGRDLETWESYATTGMHGFSEPARVVFRCLSDRKVRARAFDAGDKSEAERLVALSSDDELRSLLDDAEPVD
jgi:hypothetical protein